MPAYVSLLIPSTYIVEDELLKWIAIWCQTPNSNCGVVKELPEVSSNCKVPSVFCHKTVFWVPPVSSLKEKIADPGEELSVIEVDFLKYQKSIVSSLLVKLSVNNFSILFVLVYPRSVNSAFSPVFDNPALNPSFIHCSASLEPGIVNFCPTS